MVGLGSFKKYGQILLRGGIAELAPEIAKGVLCEMLKERKVNVPKAVAWVEHDSCLWDELEPNRQAALIRLVRKTGSADWLTVSWGINAIKEEFPAVASLFLGWRKGGNWLKRQVERVKKEIEKDGA